MKKSLYMTTALAAAGVLAFGATDVIAAEKAKKKKLVKMSISSGGFFNTRFGVSSNSSKYESTNNATGRTHYDAFDIKTDSEVYFKGNTELDNGVKVDVVIQLETDAMSGGTIDESYVQFALPDAGTVKMGATKGASPASTKGPSVGAVSPSPDVSAWIMRPSAIGFHTGTTIGAGDAYKITYSSEDYNGVTFGGSYTPSATNSNEMPRVGGNAGSESQIWDAGVKYTKEMGGATVKVDFGYWEQRGTVANSYNAWRTGASWESGGITVGASFMEWSDSNTANAGNNDTKAWDAGIKYEAGDAKFSLKVANQVSPMSITAGDDEATIATLGASYKIGEGVDFVASVVRADWDDETTSDANNNDGWAVVGGINVAF